MKKDEFEFSTNMKGTPALLQLYYWHLLHSLAKSQLFLRDRFVQLSKDKKSIWKWFDCSSIFTSADRRKEELLIRTFGSTPSRKKSNRVLLWFFYVPTIVRPSSIRPSSVRRPSYVYLPSYSVRPSRSWTMDNGQWTMDGWRTVDGRYKNMNKVCFLNFLMMRSVCLLDFVRLFSKFTQ